MDDTEDEDVLLEAELEPIPDVSNEDSEVHSHNWPAGDATEQGERKTSPDVNNVVQRLTVSWEWISFPYLDVSNTK